MAKTLDTGCVSRYPIESAFIMSHKCSHISESAFNGLVVVR